MSEYERMKADYDRMKRNEEARIGRAEYERGLRRGMAIAREHYVKVETPCGCDYDLFDVQWGAATEQMEREIEEAKR